MFSRTTAAITDDPFSTYRYYGGEDTPMQLLVEKGSGMPFAAFVDREVLQPLSTTYVIKIGA